MSSLSFYVIISIYLTICGFIHLCKSIFLYLSIYRFIYLFICRFIHLFICRFIHLSIFISIYLSVCLFVYFSFYLTIYLYRKILRDEDCLPLLLNQLGSPSLTIVSNSCGTLWNFSARNAEDQRLLWELGAVPMLQVHT